MLTLFPILAFLAFTYFLIKRLTSPLSPAKNLPPSPPSLWIIGNLHQLDHNVHRSLLSLSKRYGSDLMLLHFGSKPVLVASSSSAAKEIMKTHDLVFASRAKLTIFDKLLYNGKEIATAPYGEYWRKMRSVCALHVLSNKRVQSFKTVRKQEVGCLITKIRECSSKSLPVNLTHFFGCLANDIISRIAFGRKYSGEDGVKFQKLIEDFMTTLGSQTVGEYIPWLRWVNWINGLNATVDRVAKEIDEFVEAVIEEHMDNADSKLNCEGDEDVKDFVHLLLQLQKESTASGSSFDRESVKGLILDMFLGGSDTSSTTLEWAMTELIRHPAVMKKLQNEVKKIAEEKANPAEEITEDDLHKLHYLKLVIKETLRLHMPLPMVGPQETTQDVKVMGYDIAAGTMVLTNIWAVARDPRSWTKPEEFWPERFLTNPVDFKGHDFEFIPFGAGRRICPGISFAMPIIELAVANLVNSFDWKLPGGANGEDLDITECFGVVARRKNPLLAIAVPISEV